MRGAGEIRPQIQYSTLTVIKSACSATNAEGCRIKSRKQVITVCRATPAPVKVEVTVVFVSVYHKSMAATAALTMIKHRASVGK